MTIQNCEEEEVVVLNDDVATGELLTPPAVAPHPCPHRQPWLSPVARKAKTKDMKVCGNMGEEGFVGVGESEERMMRE